LSSCTSPPDTAPPATSRTPIRGAARDLYADWDYQIRGCVARLRALAGTDPDAPDLAALIGELLLKSPDFAKLWERYDVTTRAAAQNKTFHHPRVGTITLSFQGMQLEGTPGQRLGTYLAAPATPDYDAMVLLDMTVTWQSGKLAAQHSTDAPPPGLLGGLRVRRPGGPAAG
jgi:MmyB-like transcription regulator ligand binding domain